MERDYSATPLAKKLGIEDEMTVALVNPPAGAVEAIGPLPDGARLSRRVPGADLLLWWPADARDLSRRVSELAVHVGPAGVWVLWAKRSSGVKTDVTEQAVRAAGLATGLVDNKVAAFDGTWSALRFVPRRGDRAT